MFEKRLIASAIFFSSLLVASFGFAQDDRRSLEIIEPDQTNGPPGLSLSELQRIQNTYIIRVRSDIPADQLPGRARAMVAGVGGELGFVYENVFHGFSATMSDVAIQRLIRTSADIVSVQRDGVVTAFGFCDVKPDQCDANGNRIQTGDGTTNTDPSNGTLDKWTPEPSGDCPFDYTWSAIITNMSIINTRLEDRCGVGTDVYILDTGVDLTHVDLDPVSYNSVDCSNDKKGCVAGGDDGNGHGTHVAGTTAARANPIGAVINGSWVSVYGVASGARVHSVRVLRNGGTGTFAAIIAGIDWVNGRATERKHPVVVNMSLGGSGYMRSEEDCSEGSTDGWTDALHIAICDAALNGVVFVVAAGNDNGDDAAKHVPAAYDDAVITVAATDSSDVLASFSNIGEVVDVAAPGVGIVSTWPGDRYARLSGTSMASPHVAGAVAVYIEKCGPPQDFSAFTESLAAIADAQTGPLNGNDPARAFGRLDVSLLACQP